MKTVDINLGDNSGNTEVAQSDTDGTQTVRTYLGVDAHRLAKQQQRICKTLGREMSLPEWLDEAVIHYARYQREQWAQSLATDSSIPEAS